MGYTTLNKDEKEEEKKVLILFTPTFLPFGQEVSLAQRARSILISFIVAHKALFIQVFLPKIRMIDATFLIFVKICTKTFLIFVIFCYILCIFVHITRVTFHFSS